MKLSDYVANFLAAVGCRDVFVLSGGASLHLIHSVSKNPNLNVFCPLHEQAAAMAADGYTRSTGKLGVAIVTSGPGATNLLTGICSAYYDSVPVIYITGQVATFRMRKDTGVRQIGFQETDVVSMFSGVTNYAVTIHDPHDIRYELEKAYYLALHGRQGPVLIDIPDDLQRTEIDIENLRGFHADHENDAHIEFELVEFLNLIQQSERPVIIAGWGVHLANAYDELKDFIQLLGFPVAPTWAMAHLLLDNNDLLIGTFGTHGTRYANFAVQNADLIIAIGSRLDTKATGSPPTSFARGAKKVCIDIDKSELDKFYHYGLAIDLKIHGDVKKILRLLIPQLRSVEKKNLFLWLNTIFDWKEKYPICPQEYYEEKSVNPYVFVKMLSKYALPNEVIFVDTGCSIAWIMQAFEFKRNQRLYHDFNNTAMGWALPASIGASIGMDKRPIICVVGDGSLLMNIQELATVIANDLPIKIFLLNTHGHLMVQQTQEQWFESKYMATTVKGGLPHIDMLKVAEAFGFFVVDIQTNDELEGKISKAINTNGAIFCNIEIDQKYRVIPQVKFGRPNEDSEPLLSRQELKSNMFIDLICEH